MKTQFLKYTLCTLVGISLALSVSAQQPQAYHTFYSFSTTVAPYVAVVAGTKISSDFTWEEFDPETVPLGFTAKLFGLEFTEIGVESQGFGASKDSFNIFFSLVLPYFGNLGGYGRYSDQTSYKGHVRFAKSKIVYKTTGTAGNRIFSLEYQNCKYNTSEDTTDYLNTTIRIFEGTNVVEWQQGPFRFSADSTQLYPECNGPYQAVSFYVENDSFAYKGYDSYVLMGNPNNPQLKDPNAPYSPCYHLNGEPEVGRIYRYTPKKTSAVVENQSAITPIRVAPNPANTTISLIGLNKEVYSYRIFDALGKEVKKGSVVGDDLINVAELAKGVYTVHLAELNQGISFVK